MAHKHIVYMMLVDTAVISRDESTILKYAPLLEELAVRDNHQPYLAVAHRAFGIAHRLAGEYDQSEERLLQALKIFEALGTPWQIGRTMAELAEMSVEQNQHDTAQELFDAALKAFEVIQASTDIEKVKTAIENYRKKSG